jgi:WD40 repeat protein
LLAVAGGAPGQSGEVMLVDSASGEIVKSLATAADCFLSARFSPDGSRLAVSGADNVVRVIDVTSGMETSRIQQHADWVMSVSWSPDGTKLASASRDRTARVYDSTNGELLVSFTEHGSPVNAVVFAADGKSVISADREKNVFIWNVEEGKKQGEFKGFDGEVFQLAVRSGELLSCAVDGKVRLHRLEGRKLVRTNAAAADRIVSLALAPTGGLLAAGAFNGEIHVWTNDSEAPATMFLAAPGLGLSNSIHAHGAESRLNPQGDRKR